MDVLDSDQRTLNTLGVTAAQIANTLAQVLEPILLSQRVSGRVGHHDVRLRRYKGSQRCPFLDDSKAIRCEAAGGARLASVDWWVRNHITGERIEGPGLIVHLAAGHGFFEGQRSPYRVEPEKLARVLELGPFART
ncbi:hypothetical protein [Sphingomonas limnosediminicola]